MANREHLQILKEGVKAWNAWRSQHLAVVPDLSGGDFRGTVLRYANLKDANLSGADLRDTNLRHANLGRARLDHARLYRAYFSNTRLLETSFAGAVLYETVFADVDLSSAKFLDTCVHKGPSVVDHRTLDRSAPLPVPFLRGCGLPDTLIEATLTRGGMSRYHSCFLSYSSQDQRFAEKLYADLQEHGVRCWFAAEHLQIGEKIRIGIDDSIHRHDRLLLILSRHSVTSQWVEQEVETALARERDEDTTVLFPIRLDDEVMSISRGWPGHIRNTRNIGDFRQWQVPASYEPALARLLRNLEIR